MITVWGRPESATRIHTQSWNANPWGTVSTTLSMVDETLYFGRNDKDWHVSV